MPYKFENPVSISSGTEPPLVVGSSALVTNLNADLLDGQHGAFYRDASNLNAGRVPADRGRNPSDTASGVIRHNGNTRGDGQFYSGASDPISSSVRYNFNGTFHAFRFKAHQAFEGSGAELTLLNANSLATGIVPLARLGTNSPSAGQFLAHDNTWKTPAAGGLSGVKKDLRTEWNANNDTDNDAFITIPHSLATTNLLVQIWYGDGAKLKQQGWGTNSNLVGYNGTQIIDANTVQVDALSVGNIELWAVGFAEIWIIPITEL